MRAWEAQVGLGVILVNPAKMVRIGGRRVLGAVVVPEAVERREVAAMAERREVVVAAVHPAAAAAVQVAEG